MGTLHKGKTFAVDEEVSADDLHQLVDSGSVTDIVAADITDGVITDAKMASVGGDKLINLSLTPVGAGEIPVANIPTGTTASKVLKLDTSAKIPAVDGSQLVSLNASELDSGTVPTARLGSGTPGTTNYLRGDQSWQTLPAQVTQVNDVETTGVAVDDTEDTVLSVAKTITSGNTVLLIASGYIDITNIAGTIGNQKIKLKHASTIVQTIELNIGDESALNKIPWSCCAVVTGLSGAVTFSVTGTAGGEGTYYGNLCVLEF